MKSSLLALVLVLHFGPGSLASSCRPKFLSVCHLPKARGPCYGYFPRYYFDSASRQCKMFIYGGCLGNQNNFKTKQDCEGKCTCLLPKVPGPCRGRFPRYYYNSCTGKCESFIYGGCQGNSNNFKTKTDCYKTCPCKQVVANRNRVCYLPKVVGTCRGRFPRYFYNKCSRRCELFIYGGCKGNRNNFLTNKECKRVCKYRRG